MIDRRQFLALGGAACAGIAAVPLLARAVPAPAAGFAALEAESGGRLGVCLWHPASGARFGQRMDERFPMCSTFKFLLAAAVLERAGRGALSLDQRVPVRAADLLAHSPVSARHVGKDLGVRDLCRATLTTSDNAAANLLLPLVGGPAGLTAFLRAQGDAVTLAARYEPDANRFAADDPRDTTSPAAMAGNLQRFVLGDALALAARRQLADWLIDNETGDARLRAGLPPGWRVGDKTGSNGRDTSNDIAVLWPRRGGTPWVLAAFLQGSTLDDAGRDGILRRVGERAAAHLG
ncbi:MAG: class A beta-lactamase [Lysobacteraceae bacterium SCN 69-123]|mgnify:FL=1|jgi:beta-lactamase class A|uniref:CESS family extended-spectrum class A beta-lactamase n=1 Tax=Stenotrophomonas acidaminiphila TaxID=128780 RepID=UPI00086E45DA|nr:class A beta-lactamase [Stenotrophomonas acidaminiphila]MBN8800418.1 class A beta-lactamase [Stenotrophomonas acidaminiphila]MDF9442504.1 class A beta-lactamase [Stenotrophomonas acidaminiphila]ODU47736.1 MAG: class A beta-lactamase [Xanthomonadaceae bacterium SCN 69-123]OJY78245.1 MAG: class A beta-lactamase [Stenotrophomonas sp. 69-14]